MNGNDRPPPPGSEESRGERRGPRWLLGLWFGLAVSVGRGAYAASGFSLMGFKYGAEALSIYLVTGAFFSPLDFLNPLVGARTALVLPHAEWLGWAQFIWTIPFLWISVSMSVRRSAGAGYSPWLGFLVLVPFLNYLLMLLLCLAPPASPGWVSGSRSPVTDAPLQDAFAGILVALLIALLMIALGVTVLESYGASVFFATPMLMGAVSAFIYNRRWPRGWGRTFGIAVLSIVIPGVALLLFALEGVICIAMVMPLAVPVGCLGAVLGKGIAEATRGPARDALVSVLVLPLLAVTESFQPPPPLHEVATAIEIAAPPESVWRNLVTFPDLPEPEERYFRLGIACPTGAFIEGTGAGAVRHCVFTTGEFVEPIRVWDAPRRLAFDVVSQPDPMRELSPWPGVHPPHLDDSLRSRRGEFRLVPLPGGRTRLEGSTWYELDMAPRAYWLLWSDAIIHAIHRRVLRHVQTLSERPAG